MWLFAPIWSGQCRSRIPHLCSRDACNELVTKRIQQRLTHERLSFKFDWSIFSLWSSLFLISGWRVLKVLYSCESTGTHLKNFSTPISTAPSCSAARDIIWPPRRTLYEVSMAVNLVKAVCVHLFAWLTINFYVNLQILCDICAINLPSCNTMGSSQDPPVFKSNPWCRMRISQMPI